MDAGLLYFLFSVSAICNKIVKNQEKARKVLAFFAFMDIIIIVISTQTN